MLTAQKIELVYAAIILTWGFLLGLALAKERMTAAVAPRALVTAHLAALMQGAMHLGLVVAFVYLDLSDGWATTAAWLLVISSALEAAGGATNWIQATSDQFEQYNTQRVDIGSVI